MQKLYVLYIIIYRSIICSLMNYIIHIHIYYIHIHIYIYYIIHHYTITNYYYIILYN